MTEEARAALAATSTEGLLTAAFRLTHRIHCTTSPAEAARFREQRDAITAEVLRRTGGA